MADELEEEPRPRKASNAAIGVGAFSGLTALLLSSYVTLLTERITTNEEGVQRAERLIDEKVERERERLAAVLGARDLARDRENDAIDDAIVNMEVVQRENMLWTIEQVMELRDREPPCAVD